KTIKLTNSDQVVLVDDDLFEYLDQFNWQITPKGYVLRCSHINGVNTIHQIHRVISKINNPKIQIDHIDENKLNNQKDNLRIATNSQNQANRSKIKQSSSKYKGVSWYHWRNKWLVRIGYNNYDIHIGYFTNEIEAAKA